MSAEFPPLTQFEQDEIQKHLTFSRRNPMRETQAQEIYEGWITNGPILTEEAGKKIGTSFVAQILGLDPEATTWTEIEKRLSGFRAGKENIRNFWEGANKVAPELVGDQNLEYIIRNDDSGSVAFKMIGQIVLGPRGYRHSGLSNLFFGAPA